MFNDFIGGGQVFLHKVRMFFQVLNRSSFTAFLLSMAITGIIAYKPASKIDWAAVLTYQKALIITKIDQATGIMRQSTSNTNTDGYYTEINAYTKNGIYAEKTNPNRILKLPVFINSNTEFKAFIYIYLLVWLGSLLSAFLMIFIIWSKFGKFLQSDHKIKGGEILGATQVAGILRKLNMASSIKIGNMPLVKDSENRHFLISGATGSGKTNLLDTILPQIEQKKEPAIIIDQTGEMIAKYYNAARGDIIFNPLDIRSHSWDFWADCFTAPIRKDGINSDLEKFAKILFGFNRKQGGFSSDPFWENSAEAVFTACATYTYLQGNKSLGLLKNMLQNWDLTKLTEALKQTPASRYLTASNKVTASSILSVVTTSTHPLQYLSEVIANKRFALREYIKGAKEGKQAWLFLATSPSHRELTLPLISCQLELAVSYLMTYGNSSKRNLWIVLDEFAALGQLPALNILMPEGRKYGACVIAAMQSLNQLYLNYGQYAGSAIFGQFGTKFFFRNDEPQIAKMISDLAGSELINKQQKNTSFGANEFRDGVSYTEQEKYKKLIEYSDIASLAVGECYVLLPEPKVRLSKMQIPESTPKAKNPSYLPLTTDNMDTTNTTRIVEKEIDETLRLSNTHYQLKQELNQDKEQKIEEVNLQRI